MQFVDILIVFLALVLAVIWGASKLKSVLKNQVSCVSPAILNERLQNKEELVLIDVREKKDFNNFLGHLVHSINIPFLSLRERLEKESSNLLDLKDIPIVVIEHYESMKGFKACKILKDFGFCRVELLDGGINKWVREGYPTTR